MAEAVAAVVAAPPRVAVIGAGVTGASAVSHLAKLLPKDAQIFCFDQGRNVGGRACSRFVRAVDGERAGPEIKEPAFAYDHGCQFFRADSAEFQEQVLREWLEKGWAAPWLGRFGILPPPNGAGADVFFGVPAPDTKVYCGVGGMHRVASGILEALEIEHGERVTVRRAERVQSVEPAEGGKGWELKGTTGIAALHTTREEEACKTKAQRLSDSVYDAVLVTDASASFAGWHRASAGLPEVAEEMLKKIRSRVRVPLFTCFVAFESVLEEPQLDGITFQDSTIWFAARNPSKPGFATTGSFECWTLVSTAAYACSEIERVPMQDPKTGAFLPQEASYLLAEDGPCKTLLNAFQKHVGKPLPKVLHMDGQRWGSAFPAPVSVDGRDEFGHSEKTSATILNVRYDREASRTPLRSTPKAEEAGYGVDFVASDALRLFYAGDFASTRPPGVEASVLSGRHAAEHIATLLGSQK